MNPSYLGFGVAALAIISATVAVSLGHIDTQTYSTLVGAALGGGITFGAHASGVSAGTSAVAAAPVVAITPPAP